MQLLWLIPSIAMGVFYGLSTGMWQLAIMSGVSGLIALLVMLRKQNDPQLQVTSRGVLINGSRVRRPFRLWPKTWRAQYREQLAEIVSLLPQELTKTNHEPLSFVAGYGIELNLAKDGPHLFLVGPTGSGKSRWLTLLLRSLSGNPELRLADFKGGATLGVFGECITDLDLPETRREFWQSLIRLLAEREHYLIRHGVAISSQTSLRPVVVVIDELASALREDRDALPALSAVAARGRSLGVHLICATQSVSGVPRELVVNLNLRVLLGGIDEVDAMQLGAKGRPPKRAGVGSGLVVGGAEFGFPTNREPTLATLQPGHEP